MLSEVRESRFNPKKPVRNFARGRTATEKHEGYNGARLRSANQLTHPSPQMRTLTNRQENSPTAHSRASLFVSSPRPEEPAVNNGDFDALRVELQRGKSGRLQEVNELYFLRKRPI